MKLRSVNILLPLLATSIWLVGLVSSICVVRNAIRQDLFWYQCSGLAANYSLDVKRAPLGLERVSFTNSNIPVLKNASFSRLGQTLKLLVISDCKLVEIEDRSFQGLANVVFLDLSGNKLRSLNGVWFQDLPNVQHIYLKYNKISYIEDSFYTSVPRISVLGLANNQLNCLSTSSMLTFHVQAINLIENPLTWKCIAAIVDWGSSNNIKDINLGGLQVTYNITKSCMAKSPTPDPGDKFLNTCVEKSLSKLLPAEENYTVERLCQFSAGEPSSYLDCAE